VTTVEYIPAVGPPAPQGQGQHKDWIAAVDGAHNQFIVTGCYDAVVRVWTAAGECKAELRGHTDVVTSVATLPDPKSLRVVSGCKDGTAALWRPAVGGSGAGSSGAAAGAAAGGRMEVVFAGHDEAVQAVAAAPDARAVVTGSWDHTVAVWTWSEADVEAAAAAPAGKKRKTSSTAAAGDGGVAAAAAVAGAAAGEMTRSMEGHAGAVVAVCWPSPHTIYSASWDRSVRQWDAETGALTQVRGWLASPPLAVHPTLTHVAFRG
jgi:ribosome biogenesis protein YTM1